MTAFLPKPGELFVALDADGRWCRELVFVDFADGRADRMRFRVVDPLRGGCTGELVLLSPPEVARPRLYPTAAPPPPAKRPRSRGITDAQRRALFAESSRLGMDIDDLRAAVPGGSISRLTRAEAAEALERLRGRATHCVGAVSMGPASDVGPSSSVGPAFQPVSDAQMSYAADLAAACGLDKRDFARWLVQRFAVDNVACLSRSQARSVIQALLQMRSKRGELDARRLRKRSFA